MHVHQDSTGTAVTGLRSEEAVAVIMAAGQSEETARNALGFARRDKKRRPFKIDRFATEPGPEVRYFPATDSYNVFVPAPRQP